MNTPLLTNDAVIFGIIMLILGFVFTTSSSDHPIWKRFYSVVPALLMCYFLPSLLGTFGIIDPQESNLYFVASRYMLPASLVLLTISVDLKEILKLGPKALIMFITATLGIVFGGPLAILLFSAIAPDVVSAPPPNEVWRGMTAIAGSWIGGGANQAAMKEVFEVNDVLFSKMVAVDIIVGNTWLGILLAGIGYSKVIDRKLKADASAIEHLKEKMEAFQASITKTPSLTDLMKILAVGFICTAAAHYGSDLIAPAIAANYPYLEQYSLTSGFFWIVVIATTLGVGLSFTKAKNLEGAGASKIGSVFIYILVATIGMHMDVMAVFDDPALFAVGAVWMLIHVTLLILVAKLIRAPYFFVAVGSTANVGGAASAPVVAAAFHPSLAPVGVLLAVLGYVLGTYGAYLCGILMGVAAP
ncbi:DUF819 family protein [Marinoscillum furvescens]|uniref:Putative membrane protein n=1 Tax=Marinoscillum furvescens DSM 4134 TaxID=1122208 RepID=A0A3D9L0U4_MARFU|nr:DUF819 family protein [Marinoscillum furvescens]RED93840.1 putative membrane protein [Marinoscillum furvescens DSM 4134]